MSETGGSATAEAKLTASALQSLPASESPYSVDGYEVGHQDGSRSQPGADCGTSVAHSLEPLEAEHRLHAHLESVDSVTFGVTGGQAIVPVDTDLNDDLARLAQADRVGPEAQSADGPIVVTSFAATRDEFEVERAMAKVEHAFAIAAAGPPARGTCGIGLVVAVLLVVTIPTVLLATVTMSVSITACGAVLFAAVALATFKMMR